MAHGFADLLKPLACGRLIIRSRVDSLLHDLELLHEDGSELFDEMGSVAGVLELDDDGLDDLIVDAFEVDLLHDGDIGVAHLIVCC